jgi:hypothetical protein
MGHLTPSRDRLRMRLATAQLPRCSSAAGEPQAGLSPRRRPPSLLGRFEEEDRRLLSLPLSVFE